MEGIRENFQWAHIMINLNHSCVYLSLHGQPSLPQETYKIEDSRDLNFERECKRYLLSLCPTIREPRLSITTWEAIPNWDRAISDLESQKTHHQKMQKINGSLEILILTSFFFFFFTIYTSKSVILKINEVINVILITIVHSRILSRSEWIWPYNCLNKLKEGRKQACIIKQITEHTSMIGEQPHIQIVEYTSKHKLSTSVTMNSLIFIRYKIHPNTTNTSATANIKMFITTKYIQITQWIYGQLWV